MSSRERETFKLSVEAVECFFLFCLKNEGFTASTSEKKVEGDRKFTVELAHKTESVTSETSMF